MRSDAKVYILTRSEGMIVRSVDASLAHLLRGIEAQVKKHNIPDRYDVLAALRLGQAVEVQLDGKDHRLTSVNLGDLAKDA